MKMIEEGSELSEDIEIMGPGQILADARKLAGLSQQQVADKLKFRLSLVQNIEAEIFDKTISATYNRGYLKNYAKLVNVSIDEVISSFEMLGVAEVQYAEMQSFSRITEKRAQNSMLMWVSYFILALLIGSTVMWWLQDPDLLSEVENTDSVISSQDSSELEKVTKPSLSVTDGNVGGANSANDIVQQSNSNNSNNIVAGQSSQLSELESVKPDDSINSQNQNLAQVVSSQSDNKVVENEGAGNKKAANAEEYGETLIFTFSGDCWVNIIDGTGIQRAWGIKKSGYVMKITGEAPWNITLGKPELVSLNYEGQEINMSQFGIGNIARFILPVEP